VDQGHGHGGEHAGALVPGRFWPWGPDARWVKGRGLYRDSILPITEAWEEAVGRRTCGRALAQNGDDIGTVGDRRRVVGVGSFTGVEAAFYRVEARRGAMVPSMAGVEGASMLPGLKVPITREMKREGAA
jgi:hypothetical protein